jgi:hypothetical protein
MLDSSCTAATDIGCAVSGERREGEAIDSCGDVGRRTRVSVCTCLRYAPPVVASKLPS